MLPNRLVALLAIAVLSAHQAHAAEDPYVPPDLEPWVPWVLDGKDYLACPFIGDREPAGEGDYWCAWPGALKLLVDKGGVSFQQRWSLDVESDIPLPGGVTLWPESVTSDGNSLPVTHKGAPVVRLGPGDHVVSGRIEWQRRPATLPVPPTVGMIELTVDGKSIAMPQRNGNQLWLGDRQREAAEPATVSPVVYRRLVDGLPAVLITRLQLRVSGPEREELMGRILPTGFTPLGLDSQLPARIEADGRLRLQLRPGYWELTMSARADGLLESAGFDASVGAWPEDEVWSYQGNDRLRVTLATGGVPLDPAQAGVPGDWQQLPAFRLASGDRLNIEERSRGQGEGIDNRLRLYRTLWLDFDGGGYTALDNVSGQMNTGWRLGMAGPWRLAGATVSDEPALVTSETTGETGVEVRHRNLAMLATARLEAGGEIPIGGWDTGFDRVDATLNLPPGYRLIAAPGADSSPNAWISRWQLMDYFLLLLIAGVIGRLADWRFGIIAGVMLIITWQEPGAPIIAWLAVAIGVALAKYSPEGRLRRWSVTYRNLSLAALVLIALPFAGHQLTQALFPQLDRGPATSRVGQVALHGAAQRELAEEADLAFSTVAPEIALNAPAEVLQRKERRAVRSDELVDKVTVTGSRISPEDLESFRKYPPGTVVQTGPGRPAWSYTSYPLSWSGPVSEADKMRLVVIGDGMYRLLRIVGVHLIGLLIWRLAGASFGSWPSIRAGRSTSAALLLVMVGLFAPFGAPDAQTPDPVILEELERRLSEPPECAPSCSEVSRATVVVTGETMTIGLAVSAQEDVAVAVPGQVDGWLPTSVMIDGRKVDSLQRYGDILFARVPAGLHLVSITGPMPALDELRLPFPRAPRHIEVTAEGWSVAGVREGKLPGGTLQLIRVRQEGEIPGGSLEPGLFPPFVRVTRSLTLGLEWSVQTTVQRIAPARTGFSIAVPLLDGESVLTPNMDIRDDGTVMLRFGADRGVLSWSSTLEARQSYVLDPGGADDRQETWRVTVAPQWRVGFAGTPILAVDDRVHSNVWIAEFQPRAGETLEIAASRPEGVAGETLVFDMVSVLTSIGKRASETTFQAQYRSTRGGPHTLVIPAGAAVLDVRIDGRDLPVAADEGRLQIPITPGEHELRIRWTSDDGISTSFSAPDIDLGAAAANIGQSLVTGGDRWVLFTSGPTVGPAVIYWAELVVFVLLAAALSRIGYTPLGFGHWFLLGIGFSTFSWGVLLLVAAWLFATAAREKMSMPEQDNRFNLVQAAYAFFTVIVLTNLLQAVPRAMLGSPNMHIVGNGSTPSRLNWFADRADGLLPDAMVISAPMWVYKAAILAWALWLAFALLKWLPWAWRAWNTGGHWRGAISLRPTWGRKTQQKSEQKPDEE